MKKELIFVGALMSATACPLSAAAISQKDMDAVIVEGETPLTFSDLYFRVSKIPKPQMQAWMTQPNHLVRLMQNQLALKRLIADGKQKGAFDDPETAAAIHGKWLEIAARAYMDQYVKEHAVADYALQAKEYYATHPEEFAAGEIRTMTQVLFSTKKMQDEKAKESAAKFLVDLHGDPARLETVAEDYVSQGLLASGAATYAEPRERFVPPIANAVFAAEKAGLLETAVKSRYGYHVVRVDSIKPPGLRPFQEVRLGLIKRMRAKDDQDLRQEYVQAKKSIDNTQIHMDRLVAILKKMEAK